MCVLPLRFPEYYKIQSEIFVRHTNLPVDDKIRELRYVHVYKRPNAVDATMRASAVGVHAVAMLAHPCYWPQHVACSCHRTTTAQRCNAPLLICCCCVPVCCSTWHLGNLIKVRGVVTRRTGVFPQLRMVHYDCAACGFVMGPFAQNGDKEVRPAQCAQCQSKGPFNVSAQLCVVTQAADMVCSAACIF